VQRELSQQEIDAVFEKVDSPTGPVGGPAVVAYDFRRADRISKSQLRAIHTLHESFVRNLVSSLSAYLDSYVFGNLVSVEQLPLSDFMAGMPIPTCAVSLTLHPAQGSAVIEISPAIVHTILDMLLGGKGAPPKMEDRELTDIEQRVLEAVIRVMVQNLTDTWKNVGGIEFQIQSLETDPGMLRIVKPSESLVAIGMELRINDRVGLLNLAIPSVVVKSMSREFERQWSELPEPSAGEREHMYDLVKQSRIALEASLQDCSISLSDLLRIEPGDILSFGWRAERQMDCYVNGQLKFKGRIVRLAHKRSFLIEPPDENPALAA